MDITQFHQYVGETIMFCQCIENDIKYIFSAMKFGDFNSNFNLIKKWTLGKTITELQLLDNSDNDPFFSTLDYQLLNEITGIRNHWAHKGYILFVYEKEPRTSSVFSKQSKRLLNDHGRLEKLSDKIEQVRLDFLRSL